MKKILFLVCVFIVLSGHDMFLKFDSFFLEPHVESILYLYNGTFDQSDNVITRDRMVYVDIVGNGVRNQIDTSQWTEDDKLTLLHFKTGDPGTYVTGVSTRARNIEMTAKDFNDYLEHDGVMDELESRKEGGTMNQPAIEKYSKHVKAIFQVGDSMTNDWQIPLNYPIEFIPGTNPYLLAIGDEMKMQLMWMGKPLANQLVYAGFAGSGHTHDDEHEYESHHHEEKKLRTDSNGMLFFKLDHGGKWYVRTIHMKTSTEAGLTHESNWATLTFEVSVSVHGINIGMIYIAVGLIFVIGLIMYLKKLF